MVVAVTIFIVSACEHSPFEIPCSVLEIAQEFAINVLTMYLNLNVIFLPLLLRTKWCSFECHKTKLNSSLIDELGNWCQRGCLGA